jgi:hypothetical protein
MRIKVKAENKASEITYADVPSMNIKTRRLKGNIYYLG